MPFKINDQVRSVVDSGRIGVVVGLGPVYAGVQYYKVFWGGAIGVQTVAEIDLQEHRPLGKPSEALGAGPIVGYAEFQRLITYHRISRDRPLRNNIYAFNASRTQFFAFQFKPLLKLLDSANGRLLICDEVGLGKTIEAGMILLEERARRDIRTVLVLCPAGLRAKWKLELRRRFDEEFAILDAAAFSAFLDDYERSPERAHVAGILSLEAARSRNLLARIEDVEPVFDLLIVDEAHHLRNFGTRSRRAAAALGGGSGTFVMLTATPVHLGTDNLFSLLNLLDHRDFPDAATAEERFRQNEPIVAAQRLVGGGPQTAENALAQLKVAARSPWVAGNPLLDRVRENLAALAAATDADEARRLVFAAQRDLTELNLLSHIFTRTRKRDVKIAVPVREAHAWVVNLSPQERLFYEAASALLSKERERLGASPVGIRWALNTLQRRMASSIHATVEYYRTHRPFDVADRGDDEGIEENGEDQQPEKGQLDELRRTVRALVDQWPSNSPDSKCERLLALIREQSVSRPGRKLIVFAFFKETLRYLSRRLTAGGIGHVRVDGSVAPEDREALIARFRDEPHCQVMLSSRVGSEGLDFQFCDSLVNYDLPWNPMEVEQRIGRLDRIGQKSPKIHIFNLWTADTIEQRILMRLYERIGIFERSIGSLDAIIGDILEDLDAVLLDPELTPEEQEAEAERIAQVIESGRRNLEELEQKATAFLGVDGFFEREIEGIREGRRYVTGEQLLRFLEDYLRQKAPATRLRYDRQTRKGVIVPDAELRRLAQHHHRAGELVRLIGAGSGGVPFTVDPEVAFEDQSIEFINVLHPLVEIIRESYAEDLASRVSAQRVALRTAKLPPGDYIFVVYRLRMEGVRVLNFLEAVILDQRLQEVCDRETAEALIGEMVELGHDPEDASLKLDADFAASAAKRAEDVFVARVAGIRADFERENAATVDRRIASLRFQLERQLTRRRELLVRQKEEARPERILQLTRGQISKLEGELSRRLAELEVHRHVQVGYEEVAAGILEAVE